MANAIPITAPGDVPADEPVVKASKKVAAVAADSLEAQRDEALKAGVLRATLEGDKGQFLRVDF